MTMATCSLAGPRRKGEGALLSAEAAAKTPEAGSFLREFNRPEGGD